MASPVDLLFPKSSHENKRLFVKSIQDYLNRFPDLNDKLLIIRTWLERIKQGKRIFSDNEAHIEKEVYDNFRENLNNPFGYIFRIAVRQCKAKLYETPDFLREFEYLASELANSHNLYQNQPGINTLQGHINFYKAESLRKKLNFYRDILEPNYESIITHLIRNNIQYNKATITRAVFADIVDQLKDNKVQLAAFLQRVNKNTSESLHIKLNAKLLYINEIYENKRSIQEVLSEMAQLGSAEDVMWLLCNDYRKTLNRNVRKKLGNLILFLSKQGVKPEMCVRKNVSAAELLYTVKLCSQSNVEPQNYDEERKEVDTVTLNSISKKAVIKMANQKRSNTHLSSYNIPLTMFAIGSSILAILLFAGTPLVPIGLIGYLPLIFRDEIWSFFNRSLFVPPAENPARKLAGEEIRPFENYFRPSKSISNLSKIFSPLVKIMNIFNNTLTPYAEELNSKYGLSKDTYQFFDGVKHIIKGAFKVLGSAVALLDYRRSFSSVGVQAINGLFTMVRGIAEVVTLPILFFKVPIRWMITIDETRESKMMDTAVELKMELENQRPHNDYAPDYSPKQIRRVLFNQAADLHKQTKEFKEKVNPEKTPFKEREKAEWKKVKLQFFAGFKREQQAVNDDEKAALRNYSKVFMR